MSLLVSFLSGGIAGFVSSAMFYPLDTLEARQQIDPRIQSLPLLKACRVIWETEGWRGFYVGWEAGMIGIGLNWAIYMVLFDQSKSLFSSSMSTAAGIDLCSGIFAGLVTSFLMNPVWVVKAKMITMNRKKTNGVWHSVRLVRATGLATFYAGVLVSMSGCLNGAIQFALYNRIVQYTYINVFMAGCLANILATILTFPYLTIRSALQSTSNASLGNIVAKIHRTHGFLGFYAGLGANLIRQVPTAGCMLVVMESVKQYLE